MPTSTAPPIGDDVTAYLASKAIRTFRAAGHEVTAHCFFCDDGDPKGKGKLYINTESWLYDCKRCATTGNRKTLLRHFGDEDDREYEPGTSPAMRRRVLLEAAEYAADALLENVAVLSYLTGRGLSVETILDNKIGYVPPGRIFSRSLPTQHTVADLRSAGLITTQGNEYFSGHITIPFLSHGDVVQLRGKIQNGKYFTPEGDQTRLYNADALRDADWVIITEGEFDCLILQQVLRTSEDPRLRATAVVGLSGAGSWPAGFTDYFTDAKRVFIALDPDDVGTKAAQKMKDALGSKARIVRLPQDAPKCDWTEYLRQQDPVNHPHGGHTVTDVANLLGEADAEGRRLWTMDDAARSWEEFATSGGGIKTGFMELDMIIKGLRPGQLMVPLAKTGVGKTMWCCNIAVNARAHPTIYVSLEMTRAEIYDRLRRIYRFHFPGATHGDFSNAMKYLRIVDQNKLREGALMELAEEYAEDVGLAPELMIVDYLGYYAKGVRGMSPYEKTSNAAMSLKEDAKAAGFGIISPHQVSRVAEDGKPIESSHARESGVIEETADILISIFRPADAIKTEGHGPADGTLRMQVLKNRNGPKSRIGATIVSSLASDAIVDKSNRVLAQKVFDENTAMHRGLSYVDVYRHQVKEAMRYQAGQASLLEQP